MLSIQRSPANTLLFVMLAAPCLAEPGPGLVDALTGGSFRADLRYSAQHRDSNLHILQDSSSDVAATSVRQYSALGVLLGYETAPWHSFSVGGTFYAAMPIGNNPADRRGLGGLYEENGKQEDYQVLGEAYLMFQTDHHLVKAGRQEMPGYRMVSLSDIRTTPITHQGVVYENTHFDNLQINAGYIRRMKERNAEEFIDMALGARLQEFNGNKPLIRGEYDPADFDDNGYTGDKKGMLMLGLQYNRGDLNLEAWNYHVLDFVNSTYLYGDYRLWSSPTGVDYSLGLQYTRQADVGNHIGGNIDTWHWGARIEAGGEQFTTFLGYNEVAYNERSYDGGTLFVRWGTPQMFNSFQVQDSELAGTRSWGVGFLYDFGYAGLLPGVVMRWRYGHYDLPDRLSQTDARQDREELTFDLRYSFLRDSGFGIFTALEGLSVQLRLAYNLYDTDLDFEAYREIHGYEFESVTDDFLDARIYLEYRF